MGKRPYKIHKLQMSWCDTILKFKTGDGLLEKFKYLCDSRLGSDFGFIQEDVSKLYRKVSSAVNYLKALHLDDYYPILPLEWRHNPSCDSIVVFSNGRGKLHENLSATRFLVYRTPYYFIIRAEGVFTRN